MKEKKSVKTKKPTKTEQDSLETVKSLQAGISQNTLKEKEIKPEKTDKPEDKTDKSKSSIKFTKKIPGAKSGEISMPVRVRRIKTDFKYGLTETQVEDRNQKGQTNEVPNKNTKTYASIFVQNICTFFNILCIAVAISVISVGAFKDALFILIILANILIGIIQEIRAKITIEKLSLMTAPMATVIREGKEYIIPTKEVVLDDIIHLTVGKQVVADCTILDGNVEVNEALLTGESDAIRKKVGGGLLSGSFITSGSCYARVDKVGRNNYIELLAEKAKKYKKPKSELFRSLSLIIRIIGFIIIPMAVLMYANNYVRYSNMSDTIKYTAGSIISMIPAGMFLLCSVALAVSVVRLAKKKALVQDLYCVEMLARVNVLCLDKTGTITDGTMKVYNCIELPNKAGLTLKRIIGSMLSSLGDNNQTSQALINYFGFNKELRPISTLPFSSSRKLSAVTFENAGTYILGAPDFVMNNLQDEGILNTIEQYAKDGYRVLLLAHTDGVINKDTVTGEKTPFAIIVLEDRIRDDAIPTIKWFKENGVKVKIISGDNPLTVAEIARRVGVDDTSSFINLEGLNEKQVVNAANKYTVFGRVSPEQKAVLIKAIKSDGNTVAMTGDGVNDILALKEADCSVAMASGSDAVRSVSHMVLMDSNFSSMPETVLEGRRVINNVQKASALFFMKTIFSIVFSVFILATLQNYPFTPSHFYMLEYFVIGIPSFFLALKPNSARVDGKFIFNLIKNALPGAITLIVNVLAIYMFINFTMGDCSDLALIGSMGSLILTFTGLALLFRLCLPLSALTGTLFFTMLATCLICIFAVPDFFQINTIGIQNTLFIVILAILSIHIINLLFKLFDKVKV